MKFADFHADQVLEFGSYEVSEHELIEFAQRFDPQPFHTDQAAAAKTRWGDLIASGFHTCSIAMRLIADNALDGSESFGSPGLNSLKWLHPVRPGDRLQMRAEILNTDRSSTGRIGVLLWRWVLVNQDETPVLDLVATSLFDLSATLSATVQSKT